MGDNKHTINFTIQSSKKPYWDLFGYTSEEDMNNNTHILIDGKNIGEFYCTRCCCNAKDCAAVKNAPKT